MTPLVLDVVGRLKRNPVPYLLGIATASNIGSVATITGNPQNIIIGSISYIPYGAFAAALAPIAVVGLLIAAALITLSYRSEFFTSDQFKCVDFPSHYHGPLLVKTILVLMVMVVVLFFLGQPVAKVAIIGGAFLLLTRRVRPGKAYVEIDWPLLVMFVGLFVVVGGLEKAVITPDVSVAVGRQHLDNMVILGSVTALLSNIISNVPAVLVLKSFVPSLQNPACLHIFLGVGRQDGAQQRHGIVGRGAHRDVAVRHFAFVVGWQRRYHSCAKFQRLCSASRLLELK